MNKKIKKTGLGRGLSTLLAETSNNNDPSINNNHKVVSCDDWQIYLEES